MIELNEIQPHKNVIQYEFYLHAMIRAQHKIIDSHYLTK